MALGWLGSPPPCRATLYPGFLDSLLTDSLVVPPILLLDRPEYMKPVQDPSFNAPVTRITGVAGASIAAPGVVGTWGADARHHYSKDQPWNSDGTLLVVQNSGFPKQVYLDGETYQVKFGRCSNYTLGDDRWHPSREHPHERINVKDDELMWFDVVECIKTRSWKLPFAVDYLGGGEGNPSRDGRFVALHDSARVFVVDMDPQPPFRAYPAQRIGPILSVRRCELPEGCKITWASVSPSGKYVVVKYQGDHPRVFDVHPKSLALTPRRMSASLPPCSGGDPSSGYIYDVAHPDLTLNPFDHDEDVIIGQEHCGYRGDLVEGRLMGGLVMVRLRDGEVTSLTDPTNEAYPHHISTRNLDRPGWVYVDYTPEPGKRFSDEIVAVKMDGSQLVQRFAQKHTAAEDCYRCESHAVPSRDGRRVIWASNWALDCVACGPLGEIKDYLVDARNTLVNLVGNASFEHDTMGWQPYAGASMARRPGGAQGLAALRVTGAPGTTQFGVNDSPNWVQATPAAGTRYRFTAWVRSDRFHGDVRLSIREYRDGVRVGEVSESPARRLTPEWQRLSLDYVAQGAGSSLDLRILDTPAEQGEAFDLDFVTIETLGGGIVASPLEGGDPAGGHLRIDPNPLRSAATLRFTTARTGPLRVRILDVGGRVVRTLAEERSAAAGDHRFDLDGRDDAGRRLRPGVYFCRVESTLGTAARRFVILE